MWKNTAEPNVPQVTIWRMRIACRTPNATNTNSQYVILIAFPLQEQLHERASLLRYNAWHNRDWCVACVVRADDEETVH
jgi:hypothetical protein